MFCKQQTFDRTQAFSSQSAVRFCSHHPTDDIAGAPRHFDLPTSLISVHRQRI